MTTADWLDVINQMADLGVERAQLIGGEPTVHRDFPLLLNALLDSGMEVEVYSNMYRLGPAHWNLFDRPGVRLATSYYSSDAAEHDRVTGRQGSHARTLANICEIHARQIPLRVGIIAIRDSQRVSDAIAELEAFGVTKIDVDHVRAIGRGVGDRRESPSELCGRCGDRKVSVSPEGDVWPCVMARWVPLGNVRRTSLHDIFEASRPARMDLHCAMSMRRSCDPRDGGCEAPVCCIPPHLK
jgi:MoaA/NifB/PqqE/SkfB family radical SAM enzyme